MCINIYIYAYKYRLKELINRGGEKISAAEVDSALLSHPDVVDAVSFPIGIYIDACMYM
jgi:non-ribosomal peptide synthetase component E (peptide arylation enzyme)